jgi:hypothetical protein
VYIVPDNDSPGEGYAAAVLRELAHLNPSPAVVKLVELADLWQSAEPIPAGGDVVDWLADGMPDGWTEKECKDLLASRADPFPVDVLPEAAARLVNVGAGAIGCPRDFLGLPVLAVAAGTIGRSVSLRVKSGYSVQPTIFAACVGPPSDGKSPALRAAAAPTRAIDETLEAEFVRDLQNWEEEVEAAREKKEKPPPPPRPRRIDVDDTTIEALISVLADNARGLLMIRDELTALVLGLNQYKGGKGSDRANLLSIWAGAAIKKDRVTNENRVPVRCPHPCMSIIGGLTPDMLGELLDVRGRADGFLDRFLFAYPDPLPAAPWAWGGVPGDVADDWTKLVLRLWQRSMDSREESGPVPPRRNPDSQW